MSSVFSIYRAINLYIFAKAIYYCHDLKDGYHMHSSLYKTPSLSHMQSILRFALCFFVYIISIAVVGHASGNHNTMTAHQGLSDCGRMQSQLLYTPAIRSSQRVGHTPHNPLDCVVDCLDEYQGTFWTKTIQLTHTTYINKAFFGTLTDTYTQQQLIARSVDASTYIHYPGPYQGFIGKATIRII